MDAVSHAGDGDGHHKVRKVRERIKNMPINLYPVFPTILDKILNVTADELKHSKMLQFLFFAFL